MIIAICVFGVHTGLHGLQANVMSVWPLIYRLFKHLRIPYESMLCMLCSQSTHKGQSMQGDFELPSTAEQKADVARKQAWRYSFIPPHNFRCTCFRIRQLLHMCSSFTLLACLACVSFLVQSSSSSRAPFPRLSYTM